MKQTALSPRSLPWGIVLWHADRPPPDGCFPQLWLAVRDASPARYVAFRDVDDVTAASGPGTAWAQIFPSGVVPPPQPSPQALLLVHSRCTLELDEDEFNSWYDTDHLPPLAESEACLRVRRFHRGDEPYPYLALYEIRDWRSWETNPARAVVRASPWGRRVVPRFQRTEGYYSVLAPAGTPMATP